VKIVTVEWMNGQCERYTCDDNAIYQESHGLVLAINLGQRIDRIPLISLKRWTEEKSV
jgi:hypothetical protein